MAILLVWEQPTFHDRTCKKCGNVALSEVAVTYQCEPRELTQWTPLCHEDGKQFAAAARLADFLYWEFAPLRYQRLPQAQP